MAHAKQRPAKPTRPLVENGFKYKPKFGLIVVCRDEKHQQELFAQLRSWGLKPKVVCV